jgi:hypothetical protein
MAKQNQDINPNTILAVGGLALLFFGGRAILQKLGIVSTAADQAAQLETQAQMQQLSSGNYFDPDYWRTGGAGTLLLTMGAANNYADILKNAKGYFNDDEAAVYGVFQSLKTRSQVSFLAMVFFQKFNVSLLGYLQTFMNDAELTTVAKITNKLPAFKI